MLRKLCKDVSMTTWTKKRVGKGVGLVLELMPHFASLMEYENVKYVISSNGNQTHNLSRLYSHTLAPAELLALAGHCFIQKNSCSLMIPAKKHILIYSFYSNRFNFTKTMCDKNISKTVKDAQRRDGWM